MRSPLLATFTECARSRHPIDRSAYTPSSIGRTGCVARRRKPARQPLGAAGALVAAPGRTMRGTDPGSRQTTASRRWSALPVMLSAVFLAAFDFNVVTVAIPSIRRGLATTFSEIQLIVAGYALSFAVLLITGGRLGVLYGPPRPFV